MKTIGKLIKLDDRLLRNFYNDELQPIRTDNRYHSPEVSETDNEDVKQKIVIQDIKWRSSTVSDFNYFNLFLTIGILLIKVFF